MLFRKSHFVYSPRQRNGIFYFTLLIISSRLIFEWFWVSDIPNPNAREYLEQFIYQYRYDSIQSISMLKQSFTWRIRPFNPNYINDYKGYRLGLTAAQLDAFYGFRSRNGYCYDMSCFASITDISIEQEKLLIPYFTFPKPRPTRIKENRFQLFELNAASVEELTSIPGIGEYRANQILNFREQLGVFFEFEQLYDLQVLDSSLILEIQKRTQIKVPETWKKLDINKASFQELIDIYYLDYRNVKDILEYRQKNGGFQNLHDLLKLPQIDSVRIKRITLYLHT